MVKIRKNVYKYENPTRLKKRYYSFLTIALVVCILILMYSTFLNITKIIAYQGKIKNLKKIQIEAAEKNISLKKQLEDLDSRSYEAIARNNLKMAREDEVLVIVHEEKEDTDTKTKDKKGKAKKDKKD